jgi:hypothetical protein
MFALTASLSVESEIANYSLNSKQLLELSLVNWVARLSRGARNASPESELRGHCAEV